MIARLRIWVPVAFLALLVACAYAAKEEIPNSDCNSDSQCRSWSNAKCNDRGRCECLEEYTLFNDTGCGKGVRDRCYEGHCDANNTVCYTDICVCKPTYTANYNNTFCYKQPQEYGDLCNTTSECPDFGDGRECNRGRCGCQDAFAFNHTQKLCKYKIDEVGKACNENQICYLERDGDNQHVRCVDDVCKCIGKLSKDKQSCSGAATLLASTSALLIAFLARSLT
ncbi:hypothetical protein R5R35_011369 [Gryllus longicercus]|uniref:Uncharacterized protein n=1 Tax=Gryllus longicercus TaxID=2509291 RepID=A0AAN9W286_9ORTH